MNLPLCARKLKPRATARQHHRKGPQDMENPDHDEMDEPYEDIVAAQAMLQSAAELLGNGQKRPFWVSELKLT